MNNITIHTLPHASAQEVFDQIADHLLTQNEKSSCDPGGCMYRFQEFSCAAGCLFADDEYDVKFEGYTWPDLVAKGHVPVDHVNLIVDLQRVHDKLPVSEWRALLHIVANRYDLTFHE